MNNHLAVKRLIIVLLLIFLATLMYSCVPFTEAYEDKYVIVDDENNYPYKDFTTKDQAVDRVTNGIDNLLEHLDQESIATQGYYIGADIVINSDDPVEGKSAFILKLRANLYTLPYPEEPDPMDYERQHDDPKYIRDLSQYKIDKKNYNDTIKKSDIVLEWYDGMTNTMLIGFYFDGVNQNMADRGNDLYLNLQGDKRLHKDFGDTVLFQQLVRLMTQFDLDTILASTTGDDSGSDSANSLNKLLKMAVTNNYKQVINGEEVSVFFDNVDLGAITDTITEYLQNFFSPFEDKIDPLTNKYLGFKFSTLGKTSISTLNSDMQYFLTPLSYFGITSEGDKEIMTGTVIDLNGNSSVMHQVKNSNGTSSSRSFTVPFQSRISFEYSLHISPNIVIDKSDYVLYEYGQYEFVGELFIPNEDQKEYELRLNALIRTDVNEVDNSKNRVFAEFRDQANDDLIMGMYYLDEPNVIKDQLTYIDIEGLQHLYGGIKFEDINLPKAYKSGFNLAELLAFVSDTIDYYIVAMVDELLSPSEDSSYDNLTEVIMSKMESTMKTKDDPTSRNTISITIDMELLREILRETNPSGGSYDNDQLIATVNEMFGIDLNALASILGYDVEEIIENSWFYITYDVDEYSISVKMYRNYDDLQPGNATQYAGKVLIMQLDLMPTKVGRKVKIVFPDFTNFKPLKKVMTYSGYIEGQFIFAMTEEVDLSELMGAFIGDLSGQNTHYVLPSSADVHFRMYYDQYIREQILANGRWTRTGRSAFDVLFYAMENNVRTDLFHIYANDVSFNTGSPIEEFGYVWVDLICIEGMPRIKVREDLFLEYFYQYMGYDITDTDEITLGFTDIVKALMEDSYIVFEPDVIRVTSSNQTLKNFFGVDELLGTMAIQIGFVQRVKNIDELEVYFAMYSVGELDNVSGSSPYTVKLHDTVRVYFDYGTRMTTKDMKFKYDPASIAVSNNTLYYYPCFDGLFMGVARSYTVTITGIEDAQRSEINALVNDKETWEPLPVRELPDKVRAYYGTSTYAYQYDEQVLYSFIGYYDKALDYYIIPNQFGYQILYDAKNDVFVVDLGTNYKYDKLFNIIAEDETVYLKKVTTEEGVSLLYDVGSRYAGYYVVQNMPISILYYYPGGVEIIKKRQDIIDENTGMVTQFLRKKGFYLVEEQSQIKTAEALLKDGGLVMAINQVQRLNQNASKTTYTEITLAYDMGSGFFVVTNITNQTGANLTPAYTVLYSPVGGSLMYTSEEISLISGVDPTRNVTKLVRSDFFLFNPLENAVINETNLIDNVITARKNQLQSLMGGAATCASYIYVVNGYQMHYDLKTGYYVYDMRSGYSYYTVVFDGGKYYTNKDATIAEAIKQIFGVNSVTVDYGTYINWDTLGRKNNEWSNVEKKAADLSKIDWSDRKWTNIVWGDMPIEVDENGFFTSPLTGGIFLVEVTIGKGMMATFSQYITLHILNRTVNTDSYVNVTVDVEANTSTFPFIDPSAKPTVKVIAPVINDGSAAQIDPYAYILLKADYVKKGSVPAQFITWLFQKYQVTINFTTIYGDSRDTAPEIGKMSWYFDDSRGSQIYFKEQDISNRVAAGTKDTTYLYTVFKGQVIALKLEVLPRTVDFLKFDSEQYNGTYTVDAIVEDTYVIPTTPIIYFKQKDINGNPYTLDLNNFGYRASSIFADFYKDFGVSVSSVNLGSSMSPLDGFINWTNPVANNVKLINVEGERNLGDLNGDGIIEYPYEKRDLVKPFAGSSSDVNSSFLEIQGYVDPARTWFTLDWFASAIVTVIVLMPNKEVDTVTYSVEGYGSFEVSDINAQSGTVNGMYNLDPFDSATWTLPDIITVRFRNSADSYYSMSYPVVWDEDEHVAMDSNGRYAFRNIDIEENYYVVSTRIGNESLGYIELRLLVRNLSGHIESYVFLAEDGNVLAGSMEAGPSELTPYGNAYIYNVNTYARFEIPSTIRILFTDGTVRSYAARWATNPPWAPGQDIAVPAFIGTAQTARIPLIFSIEALTVNDIILNNHNGDVEDLTVNVSERTIEISGVTISNGLISGRTPYEYLFYLLSSVSLGFNETSDIITLTDAIESVAAKVFASFDTQKIISPAGQTFTIQLGQGPLADDCEVIFKATGAKIITGYTVEGDTEKKGNYPIYDFRIYNDDNVMSYPDGFAIGNELEITVTYSDGTTQMFGADTMPIFEWVVSKPAVFTVDGIPVDEDAVTMLGISEGDVLSVIPAVVLDDGGVVWLSAMLPDGSRIYVRLMAVCPTITDNYSSDQYYGDYAISNGVITISDYYKVYPIASNLTPDKLPTSIKVHNAGDDIAGGISVDNIVWTFVREATSALQMIAYTGCDRFLLATAYIWGNKVELYLEVLDCTATSVSYNDINDTKDFSGQISVESGKITVYFDAYHNSGYEGYFDLPDNLTIHFAGGGSHTMTETDYYTTGLARRLSFIPYNYMGYSLDEFATPAKKLAAMRFMMPDNSQTVNFDIVFHDKTISKILVGTLNEDLYPAGTYPIDPYGADITVPRTVHIVFEEGMPLDIKTMWIYPSGYEVKYDTYRRVLQPGAGYFALESSLSYVGLNSQQLNLQVEVQDRVVETWRILGDVTLVDYSEQYSGYPGAVAGNPNSFYEFDDPFVARVSQLPQKLLYTGETNTDLKDHNIVWNITDADLTSGGTLILDSYGKYGIVYTGYIKNSAVGQPITIRVYITKWEYQGIRKKVGGVYQLMSEEVRFFFSHITQKCTEEAYEIIIKKTKPSTNSASTSVQNINIEFYPEDRTAPEAQKDYRIIWDAEAKAEASRPGVLQSQGNFFLANNDRVIKISPNRVSYYQFETPLVTSIDMGYGYGEQNRAVYVVNPFYFYQGMREYFDTTGVPTYYYIEADVKGIKGQVADTDMGKMKILFNRHDFTDPAALSTYVKGGIYAGYTVIVEYKEVVGTQTYTRNQQFNIMLVFLDMSPTKVEERTTVQIKSATSLPTLYESQVKVSYEADTYSGAAYNPYRENYATVMGALNTAADKFYKTDGVLDPAKYNFVYAITWQYTLDELKAMTFTQDMTVYSTYITVNNRIYASNCARLKIVYVND